MSRSNKESDKNERSSSSSPSLFPSLASLSPLAITHGYELQAYLSDWRTDHKHANRPQPPTPARMAPNSGRRSTAIPRPLSGTSRRVTSGQRRTESRLTPLLSPERARRPSQPKLADTASSVPSPSYHLPRSLLPRSESLLTDFETGRYAEKLLEIPAIPLRGLSKSQTTPALLSLNKDIASHSLLKPLGPPLPQSSTFNDVSAMYSPSASPVKARTKDIRICFEDTIMSRKADPRAGRVKSPYPQCSVTAGIRTIQTDIGAPGGALCTTDGTPASTMDDSAPLCTDPRFVYTCELSAYWTGRYIALMDRLRAHTFIPPSSPNKSYGRHVSAGKRSIRPKGSTDFARIEIDIEKEAMKILRSFCQNKAAIEGLEQFEFLLRKQHFETVRKLELPQARGEAKVSDLSRNTSQHLPLPAINSKSEWRMLSGTLPPRMFRKASSTISQPKFGKSSTIANFSSTTFQIGSSPEGTAHKNTILQDGRTGGFQAQTSREHISKTLPQVKVEGSRIPLRSPSSGRLNMEALRNFSHRDVKQTSTVSDGPYSMNTVPAAGAKSTARQSSPSAPDDYPADSSRRFRKSESIKQLVDFSIREVRKMSMSKRRVTSGAISGFDRD